MVGAFAAFIAAFQLNFDLVETQVEIANEGIEKSQERFSVTPSVKPSEGDRLFVEVENSGQTPLEVVAVWVVNKTNDPFTAKRFEIAYQDSFISPGTKKQILNNTTVTLTDATHDIKVVTNRGTVVTEELVSPLDPLRADIITVPPGVRSGGNFTLAMHVFNRGNATVFDVQPKFQDLATADFTEPHESIDGFTPVTQTPVDLEPQESAFFTWNVEMTGAVGTEATFTNRANGTDSVTEDTVTSNTVTTKLTFLSSPKRLFQEPDLFVTVPSPFGATKENDEGLWGMTIANPVDVPIQISRINLQLLPARAENNHVIELNCDITPRFPSDASEWECPIQNNLQWSNLEDPITIEGRSSATFLAKVATNDKMAAATDEPSVIVNTSVVTSFGVFGKTGFATNSRNDLDAIGNVYLTTDPDNELLDSNIIANITNIASASTAKINVTLADFSTSTDHIAAPTNMSILVPAGFTIDTASIVAESPLDDANVLIREFGDGSTEINVQIASSPGTLGASGAEAATIRFEAEAPTVSDKALYGLFILASGQTGNGFPTVTFTEAVLQVLPP